MEVLSGADRNREEVRRGWAVHCETSRGEIGTSGVNFLAGSHLHKDDFLLRHHQNLAMDFGTADVATEYNLPRPTIDLNAPRGASSPPLPSGILSSR